MERPRHPQEETNRVTQANEQVIFTKPKTDSVIELLAYVRDINQASKLGPLSKDRRRNRKTRRLESRRQKQD